jgi:hypothetical protein
MEKSLIDEYASWGAGYNYYDYGINSACGEFHPRKHPKMNYATQNRLAKKRRNKLKK